MKRILSSLLILSAFGAVFTGCLKDKGFDNHTYGINDPDSQPPGIGFINAGKADHRHTLAVDFIGTDVTNSGDALVINLEGGKPAASDIVITFQVDTMLVLAYNALPTATATLKPLKPNQYTVATTATIPAGQTKVLIPITIKTPNSLNPNITYGLGFRILSVTGGYTIASNLKTLVLAVSIKNAYDGVYTLKGIHNRAPYDQYPFVTTVEMWTTGASSVAMYWPPGGDFGQPIGTGPGTVGWYGNAVSPNFTFSPALPATPTINECPTVTVQVGAAVTLAMVTNDVTPDSNPDGPIFNRYEQTPKKMYLTFQYNNNNLRRFYDTLTYVGAR